jgi:hypothetical protein
MLKRGTEVLQRYDYVYGQIDRSGNLDTTKNNGQLGRIESYIGAAKQWTQKLSYDSIGRLSEAKEYRGDTNALTYKQHFDFDRFGNLYRKAANNGTTGQENPLPYTPIEDADISKSTNRFTTDTAYDEAGDVTADNKFHTMGFAYDANGRMVKATKENTSDALSVYDAAGMRVVERVTGEMAKVWTMSLVSGLICVLCFITSGCPQEKVSPECFRFYREINSEQREREFDNFDTETQFRIYRCGFDFMPIETAQSSQIARKGPVIIPDLLNRLRIEHDPVSKFAIIIIFERMSARGYLDDRNDVIDAIASTISEMEAGWAKDYSEDSLSRIRENISENENNHNSS